MRVRWISSAALVAMFLGALLSSTLAQAACGPNDPDIDVAHMRVDCSEITGFHCETSLDAMHTWVDDCRQPDATNPLLIEVGPGTFLGQFFCAPSGFWVSTNYDGHVTFRGAGREATILRNNGNQNGVRGPFFGSNCDNIAFEDMTLHGTAYPVSWYNGGSSRWTNVMLRAGPHEDAVGWVETPFLCDTPVPSVHYLFDVSIDVTYKKRTSGGGVQWSAGIGYAAACGETWMYNSEIIVRGDGTTTGDAKVTGVTAHHIGSFRGFATTIKVSADNAGTVFNPDFPGVGLTGVFVGENMYLDNQSAGGGLVHLHGSEIIVDAAPSASNASAIYIHRDADPPDPEDPEDPGDPEVGVVHTHGTAVKMNAVAPGVAKRLRVHTGQSRTPQAPHLWPAGDERPDAADASVDTPGGHDLFVETDCASDGDCSCTEDANCSWDPENQPEPHLMIYGGSPTCNDDDPWFDANTGRCRNVTN